MKVYVALVSPVVGCRVTTCERKVMILLFDITESLNRFEVFPILSNNRRFPPASANSQKYVERHAL